MVVSMEALKSTALVPGEPEYRTEYNLLNMLLTKIPKEVDLRLILKARPLQPRHIVALEELHGELFPIRYDPKFFVVACSTECGLFDGLTFQDLYDPVPVNSRDLDWYENQIMSIGLFLPRSYVSFFRKTGEYEISKYLQNLEEEEERYNEFDDPLTEMLIYDAECDEFMVGFVTMLINLEVTNNLISDEDYKILNSFYKYNVMPLLNNHINNNSNDNNNNNNNNSNNENKNKEDKAKENEDENMVDNNNSDNSNDLNNIDDNYNNSNKDEINPITDTSNNKNNNTDKDDNNNDNKELKDELQNNKEDGQDNNEDHQQGEEGDDSDSDDDYYYDEEEQMKIKRCFKLNEELFDEKLYAFIYNQLYTNDFLMEYVNKFDIQEAKSIYILSTGITLGLRRRSLGTNLVLFVQLLVYYINYSVYVCNDHYYRLKEPFTRESRIHNKLYRALFYQSNHSMDSNRNILNIIKNYYNKKVMDEKYIYPYYNRILETNYVPYNSSISLDSFLKNNEVRFTRNNNNGNNNNNSNNNNNNNNSNDNINNNSNNSDNSNDNNDEVQGDCLEGISQMPLAIYLHTIYYNDTATKMYEKLNFYNITKIHDYYRINDKKYDANFLAHYIQL